MKRSLLKLRLLMRELNAVRSKSGPYRFLVRKWDSISDIDLASRVLETEFFVKELEPVALPISELRSILILAPHQDDETIGAGGTLLLGAAAGAQIDVVFLTDGAHKGGYDRISPAKMAGIRQKEALEVCNYFGANVHQLSISNALPKPSIADIKQLSDIIQRVKPEVVMAPWLLDSPAKHRLVNHLLWLANKYSPLPDFEVWGYQVHNTLFPNGYVDITDVAQKKRELLELYQSQNEHFKRYDHLAMGMAAWNSRFFDFTEPKYIELFFTLPRKEALNMIEKFYFSDLLQTYRGNFSVYTGANAIHNAVMNDRASGINLKK